MTETINIHYQRTVTDDLEVSVSFRVTKPLEALVMGGGGGMVESGIYFTVGGNVS